jgi:hypothetical protein
MTRPYVAEDGRPGRPKTETDTKPPPGFSLHIALMEKLDPRGWYRQLAERRLYESMEGDPRDDYFQLRQVTDPDELDRLMCRTDVLAECRSLEDLKIAQFNGHMVVEINPACPNDIVFDRLATLLDRVRSQNVRRINTKAWKEHRILALYDLKLSGYDLSLERKQLALWLFPEIGDEKARGDRFDRAKELLEVALGSLEVLRAQSSP